MTSTRQTELTALERSELMTDPLVRRGAQLEARYRRRAAGRHWGLVSTFEALAETRQDDTAAELAWRLLRIYGTRQPLRNRARWAWKLLRGRP